MANKKYSADQISKFLIFIASNKVIGDEGEAEGITNLKLQKILYFVEAYFLSVEKSSLFSDPIEAWQYGPVVPNAYHQYKEFQSELIPFELGSDEGIDEEDGEKITKVWEFFDKYSASRLVDISHRHDPWIVAYKSAQRGGSDEISREHMMAYYEGMFS